MTSLLLLTHERYQMTKYCVERLLSNAGTDDFELLVLDNGSKDSRVKNMFSEPWFPAVKKGSIELLDENIGIAAGYNKLLKKATGDTIVFLASDILLGDNWLVELLHYNEQIEKSGVTAIHAEGVKGTYTPLLNKNDKFTHAWKTPNNVMFGTSLINRHAFEAIGMFDESLGIYGREREQYCLRLAALGFNNFYIPDNYSIHLGRDDDKKEKEKNLQLSRRRFEESLKEMQRANNYKI